jgi:DNA-binding response OmpR family regulator
MSAAVAEVYEHSEAPESTAGRIQFGSIQIDCTSYDVWANGAPVVLTARERGLLVYLAARLGRLITREELLSQVWGQRYDGGPRTVDIHISRLRRKLGQELPLVTLRGFGYRLDASRPITNDGAVQ